MADKAIEEKSVAEYLKSNREQIIGIADKIISEIGNRIEGAPLNQLTSALSTILDRFVSEEGSQGVLAKVFEDFEDVR